MTSFLGDTPLRVAVRLLILSLLVGWGLNFLEITPWDVWDWAASSFRSIVDLGWTGLGRFGDTILLGAAVVVPVFFISRLLNYRRG